MRCRFSAYYAMGIESILFYPKLGIFALCRDDFLFRIGFLTGNIEDIILSRVHMVRIHGFLFFWGIGLPADNKKCCRSFY